MIKMKIEMQDDVLQQVVNRLSVLDGRSMPATAAALGDAASIIRDIWRGYTTGAVTLPGVDPLKKPQGGLARTIRIQKIGPFNYQVVSNSEIMNYLIDGTDEVDMKQTHTRGPRSRVIQKGPRKGTPYLIVPFRWGTPKTVGFRNVMPVEVYAMVSKKKFERTVVAKSTHIEPNALGQQVERKDYEKWGSRLSGEEFGNMNGMVNMRGADGKSAGYFTFRVISKDSPAGSWVKPATQGKPITQGVVNAGQGEINDVIDTAFRRDLGL
jgi:hypothetical protein